MDAENHSYEDELKKAVKSGMNILTYADNTEKQLKQKLMGKGFSSRAVKETLEYLKAHNYLNEKRYIEHAVEYFSQNKLYGPMRIKHELRLKGFADDLISDVVLDDIDFISNCAKLIDKRGGDSDDKTIAYLQRYGYTNSIIKHAFEILCQ